MKLYPEYVTLMGIYNLPESAEPARTQFLDTFWQHILDRLEELRKEFAHV